MTVLALVVVYCMLHYPFDALLPCRVVTYVFAEKELCQTCCCGRTGGGGGPMLLAQALVVYCGQGWASFKSWTLLRKGRSGVGGGLGPACAGSFPPLPPPPAYRGKAPFGTGVKSDECMAVSRGYTVAKNPALHPPQCIVAQRYEGPWHTGRMPTVHCAI